MVERKHEGWFGLMYIMYLVFIGLNWTAMWYIVKRMFGWKESHRAFVESLLEYLDPEILEVAKGPEEGCMVLANHVNWSDFVIDICLVPRGVYVSRNVLKFLFFPGSLCRDYLYGDVVFFKRGWKDSKAQLYADVEGKVKEGRSVIVYPEGTRNPKAEKLPLKLGLIKLAYEKNIPVYVSMTSGKPDILDEHRKLVTLGQKIRNRKTDILHPRDYDNFDSFVKAIQVDWDTLWNDLISTNS